MADYELLRRQFQPIDEGTIMALLHSADDMVTDEVLKECAQIQKNLIDSRRLKLLHLSQHTPMGVLQQRFEKYTPIQVNFDDDAPSQDGPPDDAIVSVTIRLPSSQKEFHYTAGQLPIIYVPDEYGYHAITVKGQSATRRFLLSVYTATSEFTDSLDHFTDKHQWMWGMNMDGGATSGEKAVEGPVTDGRHHVWSEELELALLNVLEVLEELQTWWSGVISAMEASIAAVGMGNISQSYSQNELMWGEMMPRVYGYVDAAMSTHDTHSIGRITSVLHEIVQSCGVIGSFKGLGLPYESNRDVFERFCARVCDFEKARFLASTSRAQANVLAALDRVIEATDGYCAFLNDKYNTYPHNTLAMMWPELKPQLMGQRMAGCISDPRPLFSLFTLGDTMGFMEMLYTNESAAPPRPSNPVAQRFVCLPLGAATGKDDDHSARALEEGHAGNPTSLPSALRDMYADRWSESSITGSVLINGIGKAFVLNPPGQGEQDGEDRQGEHRAMGAAIISNLLYSSMAYVTSGDEKEKLIGLIHRRRAVLDLCSDAFFADETITSASVGWCRPEPSVVPSVAPDVPILANREGVRRRKNRVRNATTLFRQLKNKGITLSLRVNTSPRLVMEKIKEHHGTDNWLHSQLEQVWLRMMDLPSCPLMFFELWASLPGSEDGEPPREVMIAADPMHVCGASVYVSTRFYDRNYKQLQPGYVLALLETAVLKQAGFRYWDLGGVNDSPMFIYKMVLGDEMPQALYWPLFQQIRTVKTDPIPSGNLIPEVSAADLWGFREKEAAAANKGKAAKGGKGQPQQPANSKKGAKAAARQQAKDQNETATKAAPAPPMQPASSPAPALPEPVYEPEPADITHEEADALAARNEAEERGLCESPRELPVQSSVFMDKYREFLMSNPNDPTLAAARAIEAIAPKARRDRE